MKIIKSLLLLTVGFCTTTILQAQELKAEIAKPMEIKTPAAANNKPSPKPQLKPQPQVATEALADTEAPSPSTRKEDAKPELKDKPEVKILTPKAIPTPGGEKGRKTLAGNSEGEKSLGPTTPNTIDQNPKVLLPAKSTATKQEQNK